MRTLFCRAAISVARIFSAESSRFASPSALLPRTRAPSAKLQADLLRDDLRPGDEVAIKPGKMHLTYHGKHVPVTDVVYVTSGLGIVPVLDQVRATLPRGSSSVRAASVVWLNADRDAFDLAMDDLEAEYLRHPSKLAVACVLDDVEGGALEGLGEVEEAVPYFDAGTMAVVSGPRGFAERARGYLARRGYPEDCVCTLP